MKFLDIVLAGVGCLAATSSSMQHISLDTTRLSDLLDSGDIGILHRRGSKDKIASANPSPGAGATTSQHAGTPQPRPQSQVRDQSPQPIRNSPARSGNSSPPRERSASQPSSPASQRTPTAERGRSENIGPSPARSIFPSPPPRSEPQRLNPYVAMLGASKSYIPHSLGTSRAGPAPLMQLRDAESAKREAKGARALANQRYAEAKYMSDTRRATSPATRLAISDSLEASYSAIEATQRASSEQARTAISLIGTTGHHTIDNRLESSARRQARAEQRLSHSIAFRAQQDARHQAEIALGQPRGYAQLNAIQKVAIKQRHARQLADAYYRDHEDYRQAKSLIPGDSSSSDEEHELDDYPKTWVASTARRP
ncbi:MAG: hypothetical protein GOMPHAMPRED_000002 [Gomphillus americanus]|uniref:Uncharacterized protein n=1 Tax=Gomphillus americanus TaxID=1940652 RepID=A0A8H3I376_9LECA|nr:MAG: hypothetical protein GOMPHAMPRED_000002 [Gomphillus americanus]